jgi:uncharacterized protein DUF4136
MKTLTCALLVLLLAPQSLDKATSSYDKKTDFSTLRTYVWNKGHQANDPAVHKLIVDEIERQMAALGFTKADAATADVILKYHSVARTDADLKQIEKALSQGKEAPTFIVGGLLVVLYRSGTTIPLWEARTQGRLSDDAGKRTGEIQQAIAALFETYPGKSKKGS